MQMAQEYLKDEALKTVAYYLKNKDPDVAKWYLERKYSKEYSKTPDMLQQINNYQVSFIEDDEEPK
jgi:succinate dehydrogenase flavin-adding protein (antitoxin of CptAB toxin-antitoxin module)